MFLRDLPLHDCLNITQREVQALAATEFPRDTRPGMVFHDSVRN
jgi:hypothetical protein